MNHLLATSAPFSTPDAWTLAAKAVHEASSSSTSSESSTGSASSEGSEGGEDSKGYESRGGSEGSEGRGESKGYESSEGRGQRVCSMGVCSTAGAHRPKRQRLCNSNEHTANSQHSPPQQSPAASPPRHALAASPPQHALAAPLAQSQHQWPETGCKGTPARPQGSQWEKQARLALQVASLGCTLACGPHGPPIGHLLLHGQQGKLQPVLDKSGLLPQLLGLLRGVLAALCHRWASADVFTKLSLLYCPGFKRCWQVKTIC